MIDINPQSSLEFIYKNAGKYAQAKAQRIQIEEARKSLKARLMKKHLSMPIAAQEREAYADPEYLEFINGLGPAVEKEELLRWQLECAKLAIEVWRTDQANNRAMDKGTS